MLCGRDARASRDKLLLPSLLLFAPTLFRLICSVAALSAMAPAFAVALGAASAFAPRSSVGFSSRRQMHRTRPAAVTRRRSPTMTVYNVEINFHGTTHIIPVDEQQTLLEGIESVGLEVPYSCRAGVCMTCAAKIIEGEVDLGEIAMMTDLQDDGYVLTCSGMPRSEGIKLEMNQFDVVYEQQYGQNELKA